MNITVNGKKLSSKAKTITELNKEQGMEGKPVLVEYNKNALTASSHNGTQLQEGDTIELFMLGAGG